MAEHAAVTRPIVLVDEKVEHRAVVPKPVGAFGSPRRDVGFDELDALVDRVATEPAPNDLERGPREVEQIDVDEPGRKQAVDHGRGTGTNVHGRCVSIDGFVRRQRQGHGPFPLEPGHLVGGTGAVNVLPVFAAGHETRVPSGAMADVVGKRSYLLDPRFQLKWTGYLIVVVVLVMAALGTVVGRIAGRTADTASLAVAQAERAFAESQTNSKLARQSVLLAAGDNPTLLQMMDESLAEVDGQAERNLAEVRSRQADIARDRRNLQLMLLASGVALVFLLAVMGIVITHRIVGPVHKMKRLLRRVSTGRLAIDERLRRGDELEDLFDTFLQMTYSLRALQSARLATLDTTLRRAEQTGAAAEVLDGMRALRAQMVLGLEPRRASMRPSAPPAPSPSN